VETKIKKIARLSAESNEKRIFVQTIGQYMEKQIRISDWINQQLAKGKYTFTLDYLHDNIPDKTSASIKMALKRVVDKNIIVSVYKGFYVIIPPAYRNLGILPPTMFINELMEYLQRPYYVSLLSAAALLGAAHQQPQVHFVCTSLPTMRDTLKNGIRIKYVSKRGFPESHITQKKTESGYVNISDPVLTCIDLINYHKTIGGLNRAATVINELSEEIDVNAIDEDILCLAPRAVIQRLGYLWEYECNQPGLANALFDMVKNGAQLTKRYKLDPSKTFQKQERPNRWKINVNTLIDIDE
jgi:predicted transcriptional regulator of viral defense system